MGHTHILRVAGSHNGLPPGAMQKNIKIPWKTAVAVEPTQSNGFFIAFTPSNQKKARYPRVPHGETHGSHLSWGDWVDPNQASVLDGKSFPCTLASSGGQRAPLATVKMDEMSKELPRLLHVICDLNAAKESNGSWQGGGISY